jgi:alkylhydroperoxidase/carboxymuconolactone decarboxylase family protein YurZ
MAGPEKDRQIPKGDASTVDGKQRELERTSELRGFRYGVHDFLAEVDLEALRKTNDRVEAGYLSSSSLLERKTKELMIVAACIALRDEVPHLQIHMHAAVKAGATKEELWEAIVLIRGWVDVVAYFRAIDAWRATFRADLPTVERVTDLR